MRFLFLLAAVFFAFNFGVSQETIDGALAKFNKNSVAYISVETLANSEDPILLDARKREEYEVSHLKNAQWVGHKNFELDSVLKRIPLKETEIVVYCSIGVRSEDIGEKLKKAGYSNVKNLYGGIFLWKNEGHPIFDSEGKETEKIHGFSKHWGKLLTKGQKIYKPN